MSHDRKELYDKGIIETTTGEAPKSFDTPAPDMEPIGPGSKQHKNYWVLSRHERQQGFVRPVRRSYVHTKCGTSTTMGQAIAETYARLPQYYGSTFCVHCNDHFPVGEDGEFVWDDGSKVGT